MGIEYHGRAPGGQVSRRKAHEMWQQIGSAHQHLGPWPRLAALLLLCMVIPGCSAPTTQEEKAPEEAEASQATYRVEGKVRRLPKEGSPRQEVLIAHGALPNFRDRDGEVVGMEAMTMSFPLADTAMLDGLAVGDRIDFEFQVDWEGTPPLVVTQLEKLPPAADTDETGSEAGQSSGEETTEEAEGSHDGDHGSHGG